MGGITGFTGTPDPALLARMTATLAHRGPAGSSTYLDPEHGVHLGQRLRALAPGESARLHMSTDGALVIVLDGELYNRVELCTALRALGVQGTDQCADSELLLHAWRHWHEGMVERLHGAWAFVLYDRGRGRLLCARDRFGAKPLYYHATGRTFVFGSELNALRCHPAIASGPDPIALQKYFGHGFIPAPYSLLRDVAKLPGGSVLTLDLGSGALKVVRYWRYRPEPDPSWLARSPDELAEELGAVLEAAVERRLDGDRVGAFLSGGLDSSTLSAIAVARAGRERVPTFSIGFAEAGFDESAFAARAAEHIGALHSLHRISLDEARDAIPELLSRLDEPMADASLLPTWLLCGYARQNVDAVIGGDGADELLAGYAPFKALAPARHYTRLVPAPVHRVLRSLAARLPVSHGYMSLDFRIKRMLSGLDHRPALRLPAWMAPVSPDDLAQLFAHPLPADELYSEAIEAWEREPGLDDVDRATCYFVDLYLQDDILHKVDRAGMLHGLHVRAPFLDHDVVDFARRLPSRWKLRGNSGKWLLKRAARRWLPESLVHRRKQGFALPVGQWFQTGALGDGITPPGERREFWRRSLAAHRQGLRDNRLYLWAETVLSGSPPAPSAPARERT